MGGIRNSSANAVNQTSDVHVGFHDDIIGNHANTITRLNGSEITALIRHAKLI